ncbi:OmpA family protein [Falsirhodobacter sp. alg1]|uniref:OmpA family protein n=1 Tax=Falsirhodobacter sp. alg1 TaxID=1472418 RepID=UPI0005EFD8B1|nr:OmpA family protein [Falsirhodobacter sp. alg1]
MRLSRKIVIPAMFVSAAALAAGGAALTAEVIETRSTAAVESRLAEAGITFATVTADGLNVHLSGTAPDEATHFRVINLAGGVIDPSRIRDDLTVLPTRAIEAPAFEMELLRNDDGVSLIGLIPKSSEGMMADTAGLVGGGVQVSDMLETADYPAPDTWHAAMNFGIEALKLLPRSKISVSADTVTINAIADSADEKASLEGRLARLQTEGVQADITITAPRPVLTPFVFRAVRTDAGTTLEACSSTTDEERTQLLQAATAVGVPDGAECTVGLGAPSPEWGQAAEAGLQALAALPAGSISISDADILLTGAPGMDSAVFETAAGTLKTALPAGFSLTASLPPAPVAPEEGPLTFTTEITDMGEARIDGRVRDALGQDAITSFARAQFGADSVTGSPIVDDSVPTGWTTRVLTGLRGLSQLEQGKLEVTAETISIEGRTGSRAAETEIAQMMTAELGADAAVDLNVTYDEDLDPYAALPAPEVCTARINKAMETQKINFAPGSAEIDGSARATLDELTDTLLDCSNLSFEIQGYTDSQGSEGGNQALSQARAEAVMVTLQGRRVPAARLTAVGYGEADPIADNSTEEGREANRRIEFKLTNVAPDPNAPVEPEVATPEVAATAAVADVLGEDDSYYETVEVPDDLPEGSGDGDPEDGEYDEDGDMDTEEVDDSPSFAPTDPTVRPETRPDDLN